MLQVKFGGGTSILAAVDSAALYLRREKSDPRRRAILVITDNFGQRSRRERSVVVDAWESDAVVCGLIVRSPAGEAIQTTAAVMNPLVLALHEGVTGVAVKTGGDVVKAGRDPASAFRDLMQRLRRRYEIYYPLPSSRPGQRRTIALTLSPDARARLPKAELRARRGYIVPAPLP